jgi:ParB family transcriptional regulator, chromosome partitioning protein
MNARGDRVLGRGLSALISGAGDNVVGQFGDKEARLIKLEQIGLNPAQPRKIFKDNALKELSDSIRQVGVLQPVLVRKAGENETGLLGLRERVDPAAGAGDKEFDYCLVAGERRVRAADMAGVLEIPAIICSYAENEALKVALLENIQRENLNPVEEALAFQSVLDGYGATQEELSVMLGKSRSGVANTLRLLTLESEIQELLQNERISRGHAKVLLGVVDSGARLRLAKLCSTQGLSVRDCEARVHALSGEARTNSRKKKPKGHTEETPEIRALRERTEAIIGSPVQIDRQKDAKGNIQIRFYSDEDLLRILARLGVDTEL